ncbi:MAG TPA: peptidyl-prolyl cis-trans isomerase [Blastocatellia bacterium]|nr:peptidyl-prolyl cis-trans isomerase [Blastocatellia bacterium]HMX27109.1 peptidyl-prolyl cis-trans isomerase [Blastocatellia bacterium]HMY71489.1 peptidyl-prolyl cis-trans isomerase [Blastocatellia bacterium]HMZ17628.1 peptidyl-prolyl cis-trans isomerase [Blastocatellia bacterium]HNG29773.1 peptidyl-prolyl cis-trans isomerase [Blastocatellia bacterium]
MKSVARLVLLVIMTAYSVTAFAQSEDRPVDEVIARVNAGVILRSAFESAQKQMLEEMKSAGLKGDELEKKFNEMKPRILDELIHTQLLAQRAKDLSINVEAQVNQQLLRLMKENNCESKECLGQKMREAGYDMEEVTKLLTENFSKEAVIGQEVYRKIYMGLTEKEKREAYDKNKEALTQPGEVTLSRIFIATGKDPNQSLLRAKDLVTQARSTGAEFGLLAEKFSEDDLGKKNKGKIGAALKINELAPEVKSAVENAQVGTVTDPIKLENGYYIFRVDERVEPKLLPYEDERVQGQIGNYLVQTNSQKQIDAYLTKLREDAFIEIDPRFQFEGSLVRSAQIKRVPFSDENQKTRKKREKEEKKKAEEAKKAEETKKTTATEKSANNKP